MLHRHSHASHAEAAAAVAATLQPTHATASSSHPLSPPRPPHPHAHSDQEELTDDELMGPSPRASPIDGHEDEEHTGLAPSSTSSPTSPQSADHHHQDGIFSRLAAFLTPPAMREQYAYELTKMGEEDDAADSYALPSPSGHRPTNANRPSLLARAQAYWPTLLLCASAIFFMLDVFVIRPPYGLLTWHELTGTGRSQDPAHAKMCGWDYEASWKIGMAHGLSPLLFDATDRTQASVHCGSIPHLPASFVADPFLFIPSNVFPLSPPKPVADQAALPTPVPWARKRETCDLSKAEPASASSVKQSLEEEFTTVPGAGKSCYSSITSPVRGAEGQADPWYMFYEIKNLATRRGELGASVSFDQGKSFKSVGTVLRETWPGSKEVLHLSYPHVMPALEPSTGQVEMLMIPETNGVKEVRVYRTCTCCFPFGWEVAAVKLTGQNFVDTSVALHDGRWYIFTSVEYALQLYVTTGADPRSLLKSEWALHPASPLYQGDRHFGRNGGRLIPHDGGLVRFAQDCSNFYGEKLHALRITLLTPTEFREEWSHTLKPSVSTVTHGSQGVLGSSNAGVVSASYLANRVHHADMAFIPAHEGPHGPIDARWVGVLDGDDIPDDYHFWQREGWFWYLKAIIALTLLTASIYTLWRDCVLHLYVLRPVTRSVFVTLKTADSSLRAGSSFIRRKADEAFSHRPRGQSLKAAIGQSVLGALPVAFGCFLFAAFLSSLYPFNMAVAGAHGADALPLVRSYQHLAQRSQAYAEAFAWKAATQAQLGVVLDATASDLAPKLSSKDVPAPATAGNHPPRVAALLQDAVRRQSGQTVDSAGNLWTPAPRPWGTFASAAAAATTTSKPLPPAPTTWILLAADSDPERFTKVLNLLGSLHFWWTSSEASLVPSLAPRPDQPTMKSSPPRILLVDLGLTPAQRRTLQCVRHVRVVTQQASVPEYARTLASGAWLAFALNDALITRSAEFGVREADAVLHLSPESELRGGPADMITDLYTHGHLMAQRFGPPISVEGRARANRHAKDKKALDHSIYAHTRGMMLGVLGMDPRSVIERPLCDAGVLGFVKNSAPDSAVSLILPSALACAMGKDCMTPLPRSSPGPDEHSGEHSLFSALFVREGLRCSSSPAYRYHAPLSGSKPHPDETLMSFLFMPPNAPSYPIHPLHSTPVRSIPPPLEGASLTLAPSSDSYLAHLLLDLSPATPVGQCDAAKDGWRPYLVEGASTFVPTAASADPTTAATNEVFVVPPTVERSTWKTTASEVRASSRHTWFWAFFLVSLCVALSTRVRKVLLGRRWRVVMLVILGLFVVAWLPLYKMALHRWGTFAPWNALMFTSTYASAPIPFNNAQLILDAPKLDLAVDSFRSAEPAFAISRVALALPFPEGPAPSSADLLRGPPEGWRPPHRVVVSFTTMPHHVDKLSETIDSLLAQTLVPDAIYLNLPRGRNRRTNMTYEAPPYLTEKYANTAFKILRCEDVGPLTKLVPTLEAESDPNTFVITVDSDKTYHRDAIATLVWRSHHDPRAAFGLCGWSFYWQPPPMGVVPVYAPWLVRGTMGRSVDVLQAVCGNVYRRAHFADLHLLRHPHPKCFTTDDLWIAGYLATRSHVKRVIINTKNALSTAYGSLEPVSVSWKDADPAEWQLSSHNVKSGVDMGCIRGVEAKLGPWRMVRRMENQQDNTYDQPEQLQSL